MIDSEGMRRVLDCLIDPGGDGLCVLANFSEQFLIADDECEMLTRSPLEYVAGRVSVIVTITHFATQIAVERVRLAKHLAHKVTALCKPARPSPGQPFSTAWRPFLSFARSTASIYHVNLG